MSSFLKLTGLISHDRESIRSSKEKLKAQDTIPSSSNDSIASSVSSHLETSNPRTSSTRNITESSMENLMRVMEEAEKYDIDDKIKSGNTVNIKSSPESLVPRPQIDKMKRLKNMINGIDMNFKHSDKNIDTPIIEPGETRRKASVHELGSQPLSRTNSQTLGVEDLVLERFPSVFDKSDTDVSSPKTYINQGNIPSAISQYANNSSLASTLNAKTITNSPGREKNMASTPSLRFSRTTTFTNETNNKIHNTPEVLTKTRAINRQRSKTLDTSDLKKSSHKIIPSLPRFGSSKPPPVTGKTRSKPSRKYSSSSQDKSKKETSRSTSNNNNNTGAIPLLRKARSNSGSSTSNKSSYASPRTSSGSFPSNDVTHSYNHITNNTTATSSSYSLSRRSSSIVNALSSFVNKRPSNSSSAKGVQASPKFQQHSLSLEDLPPVPDPISEDEPFETYLFRISNYGKFIGIILSLKNDPYKLKCLNYFLTNYFELVEDSLDISLRKLLIFLELPKEAQQIDRLLTEFGNVYYKQQKEKFMDKCIWENEHQVYFIIFSLLMLHTDYFNPHNKTKMTKTEFIDLIHNDTYSDGNKMPLEILAYYYDNIISKESPKFDIFANIDSSAIVSFDSHENTEIYSPAALIKSRFLANMIKPTNSNKKDELDNDGCIPPAMLPLPPPMMNSAASTSTTFFGNRPSSNSISSYFSYGNSSGPGGGANGVNTNGYLQDDINIYNRILNDDLKDVSLNRAVDKVYSRNEFALNSRYFQSLSNTVINTGTETKYDKYLKTMKESRGGYLRIQPSQLHKLRLPPYEISKEDANDPCYYLKIIQMGDIQEYTEPGPTPQGSTTYNNNPDSNRIFSLGSSSIRDKWRDKFAIATTCGLIICDKKKSFHMQKPDIVKNKMNGESNYIIDFKFHKSEIISVCSLYAEKVKRDTDTDNDDLMDRGTSGYDEESLINDYDDIITEPDSEYCDRSINVINLEKELENDFDFDDTSDLDEKSLYIWSQYGKLIWRCENEYERDNWINALNSTACLDGCLKEIACICNTLVVQMKQTYDDRYKEVQENKLETVKMFKQEEKKMNMYRKCVPLCIRTRREMIQHIKQLAVKMEWYDFEIKRDTIYMTILRLVMKDNPSVKDQNGNETEHDDKISFKSELEKDENEDNGNESDISDSLSFITFN
ncbi:arf guanine nucleotide exchange factor Syt1p [Monosporozyma servazzii]